ncbi:MAG: hypothetical protein A4E65_00728 [Syntrophorhabdus sp. PtaU1.Bin153]|nr:MAG: hypothetical protein A4E65_00728 [Syntrophorhabdus sp. PtaU1.Bin153]
MRATSTVVMHYAACPECGRIYVSGGTTTTYSQKKDPSNIDREAGKGRTIDVSA